MPEFYDILVHPGFQVREGDEFIRDIATQGIPSISVCCWISSNVDVAGHPDINNLLLILKQMLIQFMNFSQNDKKERKKEADYLQEKGAEWGGRGLEEEVGDDYDHWRAVAEW